MRKGKKVVFGSSGGRLPGAFPQLPLNAFMVDWKADPQDVMEQVHSLLGEHDLEVVRHETGGDDYCFSICKKSVAK